MKECMIEIMNPPPCGKWDCFRVCFSLTSSSFFFFFFFLKRCFFLLGHRWFPSARRWRSSQEEGWTDDRTEVGIDPIKVLKLLSIELPQDEQRVAVGWCQVGRCPRENRIEILARARIPLYMGGGVINQLIVCAEPLFPF